LLSIGLDRLTVSAPVKLIAYEGARDGQSFSLTTSLSLNDPLKIPERRLTKIINSPGERGKVFAFSPLISTAENAGDRLATEQPAGDTSRHPAKCLS
jgi:hypothetical protein